MTSRIWWADIEFGVGWFYYLEHLPANVNGQGQLLGLPDKRNSTAN